MRYTFEAVTEDGSPRRYAGMWRPPWPDVFYERHGPDGKKISMSSAVTRSGWERGEFDRPIYEEPEAVKQSGWPIEKPSPLENTWGREVQDDLYSIAWALTAARHGKPGAAELERAYEAYGRLKEALRQQHFTYAVNSPSPGLRKEV